MIRSVLAIVAGIATLTVTSFAIELVLNPLLMRAFPAALPDADALSANLWVRALTFGYGFVCVAAGGYVAALVVRRRPITHAAVMGIVQAGLTILAMLSPVADHASTLQWIMIAILSIPAAVAGGVVYKGRKRDDRLAKAPASA
jgi:hypothetical protein